MVEVHKPITQVLALKSNPLEAHAPLQILFSSLSTKMDKSTGAVLTKQCSKKNLMPLATWKYKNNTAGKCGPDFNHFYVLTAG